MTIIKQMKIANHSSDSEKYINFKLQLIYKLFLKQHAFRN